MENETSQKTSLLAKALFRIISELESLGDSGECISRILFRLKESKEHLGTERKEGIFKMIETLRKAYETMLYNVQCIGDTRHPDLDRAIEDERAVNRMRDQLRDEEFARIESGQRPYASSTLYLDVIAELERMGDYLINISQAAQRSDE